jgi:short-subunit dehydrogenase
MRPLRKNVSLFAVDLSRVFDKPGDLPCTLLREAIGRFDGRTLTPLPYRVFPADRVPDAFRAMAQAQHIGKLVVSMQDRAGLRVQRGPRPVPIDAEASYLITGGLGGFGLALASHLADRGARHIVLAGRSGPSPEAQSALDALATRGVEAVAIRADVTDRDAVARAIAAAQAVAPLRGIIHAAMVLDDAPIERLNEDRMWTAMAPKMLGAWHLHALTEGAPLDFLLLCSSITSTIGNPGQANYVAGNAFLDALAYYRRGRGLPALTVNLGNIGEVGYVARNKDASERLDRYKAMAMPIADVLDGIDDLLASNAVQVTLAKVDWSELRQLAGCDQRRGGLDRAPFDRGEQLPRHPAVARHHGVRQLERRHHDIERRQVGHVLVGDRHRDGAEVGGDLLLRSRQCRRAQQRVHLAAEAAARDQNEALATLRELVGELHRDPATQRVPDDRPPLVSKCAEKIAHPVREGAKRVVAARLRGLTVTEEVRSDDPASRSEAHHHLFPRGGAACDPVQEGHERAFPARSIGDGVPVQRDLGLLHRILPCRTRALRRLLCDDLRAPLEARRLRSARSISRAKIKLAASPASGRSPSSAAPIVAGAVPNPKPRPARRLK